MPHGNLGDLMRVVSVCVGKKYSPEWVLRLKRMVERHLDGHEFVCISDWDIPGVTRIEPAPDLPGWWQKVALFRPGLLPGNNLYLDLDVVITGSLRPLVDLLNQDATKLWALDDFSYSLLKPKQGIGPDTKRLLGGDGTINSSVMLWNGDHCFKAWADFDPAVMQELHGDQNWITRALWPNINLIPAGLACSYKYHTMRGLGGAAVTVFHGEPKVTQLSRTDPLRVAWES
jgi:hypothetical protein